MEMVGIVKTRATSGSPSGKGTVDRKGRLALYRRKVCRTTGEYQADDNMAERCIRSRPSPSSQVMGTSRRVISC